MKILVTGATGHIGKVVIETLLHKIPAQDVFALVREEAKAAELKAKGVTICVGNYNDTQSLKSAMKNIDKVLLVSSSDPGGRLQQQKNVVDVACQAGVSCIAYTSRSLKDRYTLANQKMTEHFETEDYIKASGLPYTLFRNALYMDTIPIYIGKDVAEKGIALPAGQGKVAFALRAEMGEAIGNVLAEEECKNNIYQFTGSQTYSYYDVAEALSKLYGKTIAYTPLDVPTFKQKMLPTGMPERLLDMIVAFQQDIDKGQETVVTSELEEKLGRKPTNLYNGLKTLFNL
jgi:NAD(P)H dehydrogenase (quinone)